MRLIVYSGLKTHLKIPGVRPMLCMGSILAVHTAFDVYHTPAKWIRG